MTDREEEVINGLAKVWDAFDHMEHELYADYVFDALDLLKRQDENKTRLAKAVRDSEERMKKAPYLCYDLAKELIEAAKDVLGVSDVS